MIEVTGTSSLLPYQIRTNLFGPILVGGHGGMYFSTIGREDTVGGYIADSIALLRQKRFTLSDEMRALLMLQDRSCADGTLPYGVATLGDMTGIALRRPDLRPHAVSHSAGAVAHWDATYLGQRDHVERRLMRCQVNHTYLRCGMPGRLVDGNIELPIEGGQLISPIALYNPYAIPELTPAMNPMPQDWEDARRCLAIEQQMLNRASSKTDYSHVSKGLANSGQMEKTDKGSLSEFATTCRLLGSDLISALDRSLEGAGLYHLDEVAMARTWYRIRVIEPTNRWDAEYDTPLKLVDGWGDIHHHAFSHDMTGPILGPKEFKSQVALYEDLRRWVKSFGYEDAPVQMLDGFDVLECRQGDKRSGLMLTRKTDVADKTAAGWVQLQVNEQLKTYSVVRGDDATDVGGQRSIGGAQELDLSSAVGDMLQAVLAQRPKHVQVLFFEGSFRELDAIVAQNTKMLTDGKQTFVYTPVRPQRVGESEYGAYVGDRQTVLADPSVIAFDAAMKAEFGGAYERGTQSPVVALMMLPLKELAEAKSPTGAVLKATTGMGAPVHASLSALQGSEADVRVLCPPAGHETAFLRALTTHADLELPSPIGITVSISLANLIGKPKAVLLGFYATRNLVFEEQSSLRSSMVALLGAVPWSVPAARGLDNEAREMLSQCLPDDLIRMAYVDYFAPYYQDGLFDVNQHDWYCYVLHVAWRLMLMHISMGGGASHDRLKYLWDNLESLAKIEGSHKSMRARIQRIVNNTATGGRFR